MSINNHKLKESFSFSFKEKLLACLLLSLFKISFSLAEYNLKINEDTTVSKVTVANIFEKENEDYILVNFYESAREYLLYKKNKRYQFFIELLRESKKDNLMIEISFTETKEHLLIIIDIQKVKKF
ncbi:MAG: hypothetical protein ABJB11_14805 [Ferruginibacter sp.]